MNNLNSILLEGELAGNPDFQSDQKGNPVCRFALVSSRFFKTSNGIEKETCRLDIEAAGKLALQCKQSGSEGRGVRVVGRLKQEHFRNAEGKPTARIVIVAEHSDLWSTEFRPMMTAEQKQTAHTADGYEMGR